MGVAIKMIITFVHMELLWWYGLILVLLDLDAKDRFGCIIYKVKFQD